MEEKILYEKIGIVLRKMGLKYTLRISERGKNYISINYRKKHKRYPKELIYSIIILCDDDLNIVSLTIPEIPSIFGELSNLNELIEKINFLNDMILYGNLVYTDERKDSKSKLIVNFNYAFPFIYRTDELHKFMNTILSFIDDFVYEASIFISKEVSMEEILKVVHREPATANFGER